MRFNNLPYSATYPMALTEFGFNLPTPCPLKIAWLCVNATLPVQAPHLEVLEFSGILQDKQSESLGRVAIFTLIALVFGLELARRCASHLSSAPTSGNEHLKLLAGVRQLAYSWEFHSLM